MRGNEWSKLSGNYDFISLQIQIHRIKSRAERHLNWHMSSQIIHIFTLFPKIFKDVDNSLKSRNLQLFMFSKSHIAPLGPICKSPPLLLLLLPSLGGQTARFSFTLARGECSGEMTARARSVSRRPQPNLGLIFAPTWVLTATRARVGHGALENGLGWRQRCSKKPDGTFVVFDNHQSKLEHPLLWGYRVSLFSHYIPWRDNTQEHCRLGPIPGIGIARSRVFWHFEDMRFRNRLLLVGIALQEPGIPTQ